MKNKMFGLIGLLLLLSCDSKLSRTKEHIDRPENGYIREVKNEYYSMIVQYQPPAYKADQEKILNKSDVNRGELINEYDNLQQFLVKYKVEDESMYPSDFGMMENFNLLKSDTIPCVDAHVLPYSPGAPWHEVLLLFPLTQKELGNEFTLLIKDFPIQGSDENLNYSLK